MCHGITCSTNNLPIVGEGSFDCAPNTNISIGEACALTCNEGFYLAYSSQAVCEEEMTNQGGLWSDGSFVCHAIKCFTNNLPTVSEGSFDCAPNSNVSMGEACTLTCNNESYPVYSSQAVCEAGIPNQGGVWSNGTFVCRRLNCSEWNEWNGSEYKLISTSQTWEESRQLCESNSSHLVTIENKEENIFVRKMVWLCYQFRWTWIGLNDRTTEGIWKWSDGTVSTYRNWGVGGASGGHADDCVAMFGEDRQ
ncbi:C-type lectin domain family 17, member A [Holothuria leucospilota]|uniref:C-type lectin domain family 17, member A n=1 Tax=Holothuria leucospilota TaxID=206669 RepID=A0A9Q1HBG5_HOLLE|nr:C-type lectin domain family 17, member A [Holothuria leucospilota]